MPANLCRTLEFGGPLKCTLDLQKLAGYLPSAAIWPPSTSLIEGQKKQARLFNEGASGITLAQLKKDFMKIAQAEI